jgi:hypothetical protein
MRERWRYISRAVDESADPADPAGAGRELRTCRPQRGRRCATRAGEAATRLQFLHACTERDIEIVLTSVALSLCVVSAF